MAEPLITEKPSEIRVRIIETYPGRVVVAVQARFSDGLREVQAPYSPRKDVAARCLEHLCVCQALKREGGVYLVDVPDLFKVTDDSGWGELRTLAW
jgi:hypothetical protein